MRKTVSITGLTLPIGMVQGGWRCDLPPGVLTDKVVGTRATCLPSVGHVQDNVT